MDGTGNVEGLTFSQAYFLRKKREEKEQLGKVKKDDRLPYISSVHELHRTLQKTAEKLHEDPSSNVKSIKATLALVTDSLAIHVSEWKDEHNLNLIHHCILNSKHDIIHYLLSDTSFFPKSHIPYQNPYAHVAALLGDKDCLRIILQHRPGDFFKITNPSQFIKLPDEYLRRFKVRDGFIKSSLLDKIKSSTDSAELNTETLKYDLEQFWDSGSDFKKVKEKSLKRPAKDVNFKSVSAKSSTETSTRTSDATVKIQRPSKTQHVVRSSEENLRTFRTIRGKHSQKPHLNNPHFISVYWNVFSQSKEGVLKGAGVPARLQFCPRLNSSGMYLDKAGSSILNNKTIKPNNIFEGKPQPPKKKVSENEDLRSGTNLNVTPSNTGQKVKDAHKMNSFSRIEVGVRGKKKLKDFVLKIEHHSKRIEDDAQKYMNKTPLTLAAEKGHMDCVLYLLTHVILKTSPMLATKEPLTLATKARSPESILLLVDKKMSRWDYQSAVLLAIREMYPDCLTALLSVNGKERNTLFDGENLFHVLYSQSLISNYRYEMLPEMTRVLISCKENVNAHNINRTFPLYTLITCAFNITAVKQIYYYIDCLVMLLEAKANPHYCEEKAEKDGVKCSGSSFTRKSYSSAISCILECAKTSMGFFEKTSWSKQFMKKFITAIEYHDRSKRTILKEVLFDYTNVAHFLGLDRGIIKALLRFGANPDHKRNGKFAVNVYFDNILPYLTKFEVINSYDHYLNELSDLMYMCRGMSHQCLHEALKIFLDDHLLVTPIQALPICRYFSYLINEMIKTPRSLVELTAQEIWIYLGRNKTRVTSLSLPEDILALIVP
ncbi:uncharacterized protein LOC131946556 [Physella acuta]|uniref:uncharacterized protein LOC131946556 n=1 Tax=Physella acuta TaxID=109671 RepID=UPI0027DD3B76|nr:uncharacterized protein LOC131946556 [Physella acuta]